MPRVGFEPTTPVFEWAKTVHASDRAVTVIDKDHTRTTKTFLRGHCTIAASQIISTQVSVRLKKSTYVCN
jgi:hypothetical protein